MVDVSPLTDNSSSVTHLHADVTLPSWVQLAPALQVQEVLDSTDWLVVACVSDGTSQYIWCDIDDIQVPDIPVPREHPKLTSAPDPVKAEAVRLVDEMLTVGKLSHPPPGLHLRAVTNYYPVVGKRVRPVFPSLQVNRGLNRLLRSIRFRQSPLTELKTGLRGCVHAISMDVRDAFMQLRAGVGLQRFPGLYHRGGTLVFTRVPYGLAISPHILEVAVRHVVGRLITAGVLPDCQVKVLHYMDDVFLLSRRSLTPTEVSTLTGRVVDLFARYSLPMSPKKTIVLFDTAKVNALGLEYIDHGKFVRFPLPRWQALFHIDLDRTWTYRTVLSHLGMLTAESDVLPEHCLEQRNLLQGLLASERHRLQRAWTDTISPTLCALLHDWLTTYRGYAEPPPLCRFINAALPITVYTDASQYALAYKIYQDGHLILQGQRVLRRRTERTLHANVLELYAVYFALSRLILYESLAKVHFAHLTLFTDNKTALSCLRTLRTKSTNPVGQQAFLKRKLGQCIELVGLVRFNTIRFDYVDTKANPADSATRSPLTERLLDRLDNPLSTSTTSGQKLSADLGEHPAAVTSLVQRAAILQVLPTPWLATDLVSAIQDYRRLHRLFHAFRPTGDQSDLPADLCFFRARQRDSSRLSEYVDYLSSPSRGHHLSLRKATQHLVVSPSGLLLRHVLYDVYGQIVPQVVLHDDDHKSLIHDIIHHFHCVGGHPGIKATRHLVERYFWSPKLRHAVRRYVKQCQPCLLTQQSQAWHVPSSYPAPSRPFQTLGLDLTGPYHTAVWHTASFRVLLTATDLLTKYTVLIPLANGTLPEVLHGLRSVTWSYGVPATIVCDNAKVFSSPTFARFLREYDIRIYHTPPLAPFYGGWFERVHRTMGMVLRRLLLSRPTDWLTLLPETQWVLNHVRQQEYGASPHELLFGYSDNLHFLHAALEAVDDPVPSDAVEKHLYGHRRLLQEFCRLWEDQHTATRLALQRRATLGPQLCQGNVVYRFRPAAYKLTTGWDGPYTVLERLTDVIYLLQDPRDSAHTLREHVHNLYLVPATHDAAPHVDASPAATLHDDASPADGTPGSAVLQDATSPDDDIASAGSGSTADPAPVLSSPTVAPTPSRFSTSSSRPKQVLFKVNETVIFTKGGVAYVGQITSITPTCYLIHLLDSTTDGSWRFKWVDSSTGQTWVTDSQPTGQAEGDILEIPFTVKLIRFTLTPSRSTTRSSSALLKSFHYKKQ